MYEDPPNKEEILARLKETKEHAEVKALIEEVFPDWFLYWIPKYSEDYPSLKINWERICHMSKTTPKFIVLVEWIEFTDQHTVLRAFADRMTHQGYVVRRREEFGTCPECGKAIPSKMVYDRMKECGCPVPVEWSEKCSGC